MRYLCLVYHDEAKLDALSPSAYAALAAESVAFDEDLRASGALLASGALQPVEMALTVRVGNGRASAIDGPYAEPWQHLGRFALIEARDLNDAIRVASKIPSARIGCVEVRPLAAPPG